MHHELWILRSIVMLCVRDCYRIPHLRPSFTFVLVKNVRLFFVSSPPSLCLESGDFYEETCDAMHLGGKMVRKFKGINRDSV